MGATRIDAERARVLARGAFGIEAEARELPGYADQNFLLVEPAGRRWVLKLAAPGTPRAGLEAQNRAMAHLAARGLPVPTAEAGVEGEALVAVGPDDDGFGDRFGDRDGDPASDTARDPRRTRWMRLVPYLSGRLLVDVPHEEPLCAELGAFVARTVSALATLSWEVPSDGEWNLENALAARPFLDAIPEAADRDLVARGLGAFESDVRPALRALPRQALHNDPNDHNLLVERVVPRTARAVDPRSAAEREDPGWRVAGLLDFGDLTFAPRVCEPAIALAYLVLGKDDPWSAAAAFLHGFEGTTTPLSPVERRLLFPLLWTRLCFSVARSAHERARRPDDPYLSVTEPHAWAFLRRFEGLDAHRVEAALWPGALRR